MELLLVRTIGCLSRAFNLGDPAVLPKVQEGPQQPGSKLSIRACCWGEAAFRKLYPGSNKGAIKDQQGSCSHDWALWAVPRLCSPLSLPAWRGIHGRAGAVGPGHCQERMVQPGAGVCWHGRNGQEQVCDQGEVVTHRGWRLELTGV